MTRKMINLGPLNQMRAALGEDARRRSGLMESVRHVYLRMDRDKAVEDSFELMMEDLAESRHLSTGECSEKRAERLEGNILVVLGGSGAGKTTAVRKLLSSHKLSPNYGGPDAHIVTVRVPCPCSVGELGKAVLSATGWDLERRATAPEIWTMVRSRIRSLGILVLHLDEVQDAHETLKADEKVKLRHLLRSLLVDEDYPIGLIMSGQAEFETFLRPDRSSVRRGRWHLFGPITVEMDKEAIAAAVVHLAKTAALKVAPDAGPDLVPRLIHAGCYQLGITIEEIHDAIRAALKSGATILERKHFADAFAARTGNFLPWNPYLAQDYLAVDPTRVLAHAPAPVASTDQRKQKKSKGDKS
ncbi:ATP-binding protein [Methylobacterium sp. J-001]|uniref:ATP-binding protein n=1 Tax=Methylobacterium sp. J-001 TaxID=2836609 RepID=UPI001FB8D623|nr:ATP-binding protein [Methylobacterium sp. J-001]MCJ2120010.1 ATP-binding protein [Methylobacterium sp. J-001]